MVRVGSLGRALGSSGSFIGVGRVNSGAPRCRWVHWGRVGSQGQA